MRPMRLSDVALDRQRQPSRGTAGHTCGRGARHLTPRLGGCDARAPTHHAASSAGRRENEIERRAAARWAVKAYGRARAYGCTVCTSNLRSQCRNLWLETNKHARVILYPRRAQNTAGTRVQLYYLMG
eukprot:846338-Prymnesium_polylepis.1